MVWTRLRGRARTESSHLLLRVPVDIGTERCEALVWTRRRGLARTKSPHPLLRVPAGMGADRCGDLAWTRQRGLARTKSSHPVLRVPAEIGTGRCEDLVWTRRRGLARTKSSRPLLRVLAGIGTERCEDLVWTRCPDFVWTQSSCLPWRVPASIGTDFGAGARLHLQPRMSRFCSGQGGCLARTKPSHSFSVRRTEGRVCSFGPDIVPSARPGQIFTPDGKLRQSCGTVVPTLPRHVEPSETCLRPVMSAWRHSSRP